MSVAEVQLVGVHAGGEQREVAVFLYTREAMLIERRLPSSRRNRLTFWRLKER